MHHGQQKLDATNLPKHFGHRRVIIVLDISANFLNTTNKQFHFNAFHNKNVIMKIHVDIYEFLYTTAQKYMQKLIKATYIAKERVTQIKHLGVNKTYW